MAAEVVEDGCVMGGDEDVDGASLVPVSEYSSSTSSCAPVVAWRVDPGGGSPGDESASSGEGDGACEINVDVSARSVAPALAPLTGSNAEDGKGPVVEDDWLGDVHAGATGV